MTLDEAQAALDTAKANCTEGEDDHQTHAAELAKAYDDFSLASHEAAGIKRPETRTTVIDGVRQVVTP